MKDPDSRRCPHFQILSEPLEMDGPGAFLAIRRCLMTERLIRLLDRSPEAKRLSDKIVIHGANSRPYAFVGPDLEAVTQQTCYIKRCEECCTPAYEQHLAHFDIQDPYAEEVTCDDKSDSNAEPPEAAKALPVVSASPR